MSPTVCNSSMQTGCYPYHGNGGVVALSGRTPCGTCGDPIQRVSIGEFTKDVCFNDCVKAFCAANNLIVDFTTGMLTDAKGANPCVTIGELLSCMFTFNADTFKVGPSVSVGQLVTVIVDNDLHVYGTGSSHHREYPLYCNFVQKLPSWGLGCGSGSVRAQLGPVFGFGIDRCVGQYCLQVNAFVTPYLILVKPVQISCLTDIIVALNFIPFLAKLQIKKGTQIYGGVAPY